MNKPEPHDACVAPYVNPVEAESARLWSQFTIESLDSRPETDGSGLKTTIPA